MSVGTVTVTTHEPVAVNECEAPSPSKVVGLMAHPERLKVPDGPPAPLATSRVKLTLTAKATWMLERADSKKAATVRKVVSFFLLL